MLHSLANQYGVEWDKKTFTEFLGTLGTGFVMRYSAGFAIREAAKFIPVYGQTVGAGAAAIFSSAFTYAIGRVACKYLYHRSKGEEVSTEDMQKLYKKAFEWGEEVAENEANKK